MISNGTKRCPSSRPDLVYFIHSNDTLGACRFDDPRVPLASKPSLVGADGLVLHVPVTYRGLALDGAEESLVGTMEHSVLGRRWTYDATSDPVYVRASATAITTGAQQFESAYGAKVRT